MMISLQSCSMCSLLHINSAMEKKLWLGRLKTEKLFTSINYTAAIFGAGSAPDQMQSQGSSFHQTKQENKRQWVNMNSRLLMFFLWKVPAVVSSVSSRQVEDEERI